MQAAAPVLASPTLVAMQVTMATPEVVVNRATPAAVDQEATAAHVGTPVAVNQPVAVDSVLRVVGQVVKAGSMVVSRGNHLICLPGG